MITVGTEELKCCKLMSCSLSYFANMDGVMIPSPLYIKESETKSFRRKADLFASWMNDCEKPYSLYVDLGSLPYPKKNLMFQIHMDIFS